MQIVRLTGQADVDRALCGGKGASLNALLCAGFPVPPAFCLTTQAFHHALQQAGLDVLSERDALPAFIRESVLRAPLPEAIRQQAEHAYQEFGADAAVSVRSSAPAEDGANASFAGQFESYLNLRGFDAIEQAVRRCWASVFADRVIAYRQQHAIGFTPMAVVVQRMLLTDVFAVAFSRDPLRPDSDDLLINAAWGLGEPVVSGAVTPDAYSVARSGAVASVVIGEKASMAIAAEHGGIDELPTPRVMRQTRCLTDAQLRELADLALAVEAWLGAPADIECGLHDGRWWLLQCRPITTLGARRAAAVERRPALS